MDSFYIWIVRFPPPSASAARGMIGVSSPKILTSHDQVEGIAQLIVEDGALVIKPFCPPGYGVAKPRNVLLALGACEPDDYVPENLKYYKARVELQLETYRLLGEEKARTLFHAAAEMAFDIGLSRHFKCVPCPRGRQAISPAAGMREPIKTGQILAFRPRHSPTHFPIVKIEHN